jgi:hypothetical protein
MWIVYQNVSAKGIRRYLQRSGAVNTNIHDRNPSNPRDGIEIFADEDRARKIAFSKGFGFKYKEVDWK